MKIIAVLLFLFFVNCTNANSVRLSHSPAINYQYHFVKKHHLNKGDAQKKAEELATSLAKYGLKWKWIDDSNLYFYTDKGIANGSNGVLIILPSEIELNIKDIPEHLLIFDFIIEDKVKSKLEFYFH